MDRDQSIEQEIKAKGLIAPRVTADDLAANIKHVEYVRHVSQCGQVLRWAVITTACGFAVTGRPSVAVSPDNDDAQVGEKVALDNAKGELWPLMGYALKEKLAATPADFRDRVRQERDSLQANVSKLDDFILSPTFKALPREQALPMLDQADAMHDYLNALNTRIELFA